MSRSAAGEVCAQPGDVRAAPRGSSCPALGLGGRKNLREAGSAEGKREKERERVESAQGCARGGRGGGGRLAGPRRPTHHAAAPRATRPAGRRAPETFAHGPASKPLWRELPWLAARSPGLPRPAKRESAAYRRRRRPAIAHGLGQGRRCWKARGVPARDQASGRQLPGSAGPNRGGPCIPSTPLLTTRAGFPSSGAAQPAPGYLATRSGGTHADARAASGAAAAEGRGRQGRGWGRAACGGSAAGLRPDSSLHHPFYAGVHAKT